MKAPKQRILTFAKQRASRIKRCDGTFVPLGFERFVELMSEISTIHHGRTQTTFSDMNGIFVTIMDQGTNNRQLALFLNRSRGWKPVSVPEGIRFEQWHTGDLKVIVPKAAIDAGYQICLEWKEAKIFHTMFSPEQNTRKRRLANA